MKISLLLVVATLALVTAEQNKLWKMFKKMMMKTDGEQKKELHEIMQMKKTVMKVILNILLAGNISLIRSAITVLTAEGGRKPLKLVL